VTDKIYKHDFRFSIFSPGNPNWRGEMYDGFMLDPARELVFVVEGADGNIEKAKEWIKKHLSHGASRDYLDENDEWQHGVVIGGDRIIHVDRREHEKENLLSSLPSEEELSE
jgi:hypothetical protein